MEVFYEASHKVNNEEVRGSQPFRGRKAAQRRRAAFVVSAD